MFTLAHLNGRISFQLSVNWLKTAILNNYINITVFDQALWKGKNILHVTDLISTGKTFKVNYTLSTVL